MEETRRKIIVDFLNQFDLTEEEMMVSLEAASKSLEVYINMLGKKFPTQRLGTLKLLELIKIGNAAALTLMEQL